MEYNLTNTSYGDMDELLQSKNLEFLASQALTVGYLALLMVVGVPGNVVVLLVYYRRFKPSPTRVYILAMCVGDLLSDVTALPSDIFEIRFHYHFDNDGACKFFGIITRFLAILCACILVAIAIDRRRMICQPTRKPKSVRDVYVELAVCVVFSLLASIPFAILRGLQTVTVKGTDIKVKTCSIDDTYVGSKFFVYYNLLMAVIFIVCIAIMVVSYVLVGKRTLHLKRRRGQMVVNAKPRPGGGKDPGSTPARPVPLHQVALSSREESSSGQQFTEESDMSSKEVSVTSQTARPGQAGRVARAPFPAIPDSGDELSSSDVDNLALTLENKAATGRGRASGKTPASAKGGGGAKARGGRGRKKEKSVTSRASEIQLRITLMMCVLTVLFVVSYLPYITMAGLRRGRDLYNLGFWTLNLEQVALRSFFVNGAVNPLVYSFCSAKFRKETRILFSTKNCCRRY